MYVIEVVGIYTNFDFPVYFSQVVSVTNFTPKRIPQSGNITISIMGNNFNISTSSLANISLAEAPCEIVNLE